MEKIFKFPKSSRILLLSTKEKINSKDSSYLPRQRSFFCLNPQRPYGLVTEPSSNVRTCFNNCTQFMLQVAVTTHPVYTLLPNKTEKTYHDFTQALIQLTPNANPERTMMDLEKAAVNAFSITFPAAQINGRCFHFCQSVLRKLNEVGSKKAYTTTIELVLALKMVPATDFLPVEQVEGFNLVMEEVGDILLRLKSDDELSEKVEQFACYFQKTYIRGINRAPLFEPSIWNQNKAASEGSARTNIAVVGWHYGIQSLFSGSYPDVWTFLQKFRQRCSTP